MGDFSFKVAGVNHVAGPGTGRFAGRASVNARAQVTGNWVRWVAGPPMVGFGSAGSNRKKLRSMRQAKTGGYEESLVERGGGSRGFTLAYAQRALKPSRDVSLNWSAAGSGHISLEPPGQVECER